MGGICTLIGTPPNLIVSAFYTNETGIAQWISQGILNVCQGNAYLALFGICLVGTFITEFTSNTATAAIFAPIAFQTAVSLGVNPLTFCVALFVQLCNAYRFAHAYAGVWPGRLSLR